MSRAELSPYSKGQMEFHVGLKAEDEYRHHGIINGFAQGIAEREGEKHPVVTALHEYDIDQTTKAGRWANRAQDVLEPQARAEMEKDLSSH